jgi:hypothetical protein
LKHGNSKFRFATLRHSKRALAIPVSFLILFVTTLGLVSVTYYFAVQRLSAGSATINVSNAKQDMFAFDVTLLSSLWQPGSARTFTFSDSDGQLAVQPSECSLSLYITDKQGFQVTLFKGFIGQVAYKLPFSESPDSGLYLKGDSNTIATKSGSVMTQLSIIDGVDHPELLLRYRPTISTGPLNLDVTSNRTINSLRIYVVTLNSSETITSYGRVPLRISCVDTSIMANSSSFAYNPGTLYVTSTLDGVSNQIALPISSSSDGAVFHVELVLCSIKIERWVA